jgi:hypothetical protein
MNLIIDILKWLIPTIIAVASLYYAIRQRSVVKREISKKRYLESAQTNLNEAINHLRNIDIPDLLMLWKDAKAGYPKYDEWEDACFGTYLLTDDILRASFKLKTNKIGMDVEYYIHYRERSEGEKTIRNLDEFEPQWLVDFFRSNRYFSIECETRINDYERDSNGEPDFSAFEHAIKLLNKSVETLSSFEEVYDSISPDSVKKVNRFFEDIVKEIFKVICKSRRIEIDLKKFAEAEEITRYIFEEILNYSHIASKFSKVSEAISELTKARKELFLKIS